MRDQVRQPEFTNYPMDMPISDTGNGTYDATSHMDSTVWKKMKAKV